MPMGRSHRLCMFERCQWYTKAATAVAALQDYIRILVIAATPNIATNASSAHSDSVGIPAISADATHITIEPARDRQQVTIHYARPTEREPRDCSH